MAKSCQVTCHLPDVLLPKAKYLSKTHVRQLTPRSSTVLDDTVTDPLPSTPLGGSAVLPRLCLVLTRWEAGRVIM